MDPLAGYMDQFVDTCLCEELIPDLLIEVLHEEEVRSRVMKHVKASLNLACQIL